MRDKECENEQINVYVGVRVCVCVADGQTDEETDGEGERQRQTDRQGETLTHDTHTHLPSLCHNKRIKQEEIQDPKGGRDDKGVKDVETCGE